MKTYLLGAVLLIAGVLVWHNWNSLNGYLGMSRHQNVAEAAAVNSLGNPVGVSGQRVLVAYFSWGGNTRRVAQQINALTGGDIFEIQTVAPYPEEYKPCTELAKTERQDNTRPEIVTPLPDIANYDVILIGYPIWWYAAPRAVLTFTESASFAGKTVIPFCTSGGSTLDEGLDELQASLPGATFKEGLTANIASDIEPWLRGLGLL